MTVAISLTSHLDKKVRM